MNRKRTFSPFGVSVVGCVLLFLSLSTGAAFGQTTAFTYQGRLTDGGTPANGPYDMEFKLYDALTLGNLQGSPNTVTKTGVNVTNGIFTVQLEFGGSAFPGADRFLDIGVKHPADASYTTLLPRQQLTSTPYAIQALNNVLKSGDTMSGPLVLSGNPSVALGAATKQYVDTADALKLNLTGGTLSGNLIFSSIDNAVQFSNTSNFVEESAVATRLGLGGKSRIEFSLADLSGADKRVSVFTPTNVSFGISGNNVDFSINSSALHVATDGSVGIGTAIPGSRLEVKGVSGTNLITLTPGSGSISDSGFVSVSGRAEFGYDGTNAVVRGGAGKGLNLQTNGANSRLFISSSGSVGIGTLLPERKLHIADAMRLQPIASPPASPSSGDLYFDSSEALCVFVSGAWAKIAGSGTCN